jgi:16S rRNA U516 pseudouridylate synthase RsuA-like enzyme
MMMRLLVSGATHDLAGEEFTWGKKYTATVKGKQEPLTIHELVVGVTSGGGPASALPSKNER